MTLIDAASLINTSIDIFIFVAWGTQSYYSCLKWKMAWVFTSPIISIAYSTNVMNTRLMAEDNLIQHAPSAGVCMNSICSTQQKGLNNS